METGQRRLRPLDLGSLLDETFALYRQNFRLLVGIVAVLQLPLAVLNVLLALSLPAPTKIVHTDPDGHVAFNSNALGSSIAFGGILGILGFIVSILITGALAWAISARYLDRPIAVGEAYQQVGSRTFFRLLGATLLALVTGIGALLVAVLVIVGITYLLTSAAGVSGVIFAILASILLVVIAIHVAVRFFFVAQVLILERTGIVDAFKRSWYLVGGSWWRVVGILIVIFLLVGIVQGAVGGALGGVLSAGGGASRGLSAGLTAIVNILVQPFELGALVLLYYDLRIRKEGFDLEQMARSIDPNPVT